MKWLQTKVLKELGGVSNVVQLLEHGIVTGFKDQAWHAILVRPFGRLLVSADSASMYKQAAFDIAAAIQGSFAKGIRHQDISPFKYGCVSRQSVLDRLVSRQGEFCCG